MNRLKFLALALALVVAPLPPVLAQATVPGDWTLTLATPLGSYVVMLTLEQNGDKVTGKLTSPASPVPIVGTVYPVPPSPLNYFPYIFAAYILAGVVLVSIRSRSHSEMDGIRKVLEETAMVPVLGVALPPQQVAEQRLAL